MYTFSKQLWGLHSPSTCLVQNVQIFTGDNFFHTYTLHTCFRVHSQYSCLVYTLQAHVRFKNFRIFTGDHFFMLFFIFLFSTGLVWLYIAGLPLRSCRTCFRVHSPYSYLVYTLQAHVRFKMFGFSQDCIFFILTPSTHVSEFTLHAVVFTLSKQMLHFKILYSYYNFIMCLNASLNHECLTP